MAFASIVSIPKEILKHFGVLNLPADFQVAYLKSYDESLKNFVEYDIMWQQGGRLYNAGNISVTKHSIDAFVKNEKGQIYKLSGPYWERQINIFNDKNPNPERYSRYGLTMGALLAFSKQLQLNGIEKTLSIIKEDNIASLKFSAKFLGTKNRLRVVEEAEDVQGKLTYKEQPVFIYETLVADTIDKLSLYTSAPSKHTIPFKTGASR